MKHTTTRSIASILCLLLLAPVVATAGSVPLCALIKPEEVAAMAPFKIPLVRSEGWPLSSSTSGCRYVFESADGERAGVAIGVTDMGTKTNVLAHFTNTASDFKNVWSVEPQMLPDLGDKAWFGGMDETGLKIIRSTLVADINMRGMSPEVTAEMKRQSSISLAGLLLKRLDQLKLK